MITWRLPVAIVVLLACAAATAYLTFPRPPGHEGTTIRLPAHRPADPGTWHWPDGVPGWQPGQKIQDYNVSGVQPVEMQAAQLAAARHVLDSEQLRVLHQNRICKPMPVTVSITKISRSFIRFRI